MRNSKYLIVGSSHAALEAAAAIRMQDPDGALAMVTRDTRLPYSPTILPYVVSGRSEPERILLRDEAWFADNAIGFVRGETLAAVDAAARTARFASGAEWRYEKLLLATGAAPAIPPVKGLAEVPFHVLRSMDDAVRLRDAIATARRAVVLGAGLIGMHAAENLAKAGAAVTVVEMQAQVLPGYFEPDAARMIERAFAAKGVTMEMGRTVTAAEPRGQGCAVILDDGRAIEADLLLVSTGVKPEMAYLAGGGVDTDRGILVDDRMRSSAPGIWAAGDVAQARGFYDGAKVVAGILPNAVEQGRIAGMDMAEDEGVKSFPGSVPLNTYTFFGQQAISVGLSAGGEGREVHETVGEGGKSYRRIVLEGDRLRGVSAINDFVDAGIMWQLVLRQVDLSAVKADFVARPLETGRMLMSRIWR
ncbi:MAG: NAD(P)/FAD-dependent oxidoreductase [Rhodospirillales bacterium]|nr:NAD(P)/FAD-dependent oxidoreductase [Rhodospirillales bacterium]